MTTPMECVQGIYDAFHALDLEGVYARLHDDVIYQNMAQEPVVGKQALRAMWSGFDHIDSLDLKIHHMIADGDVVMNERLDHLVLAGRDVFIPMAATFIVRDGKVISWREYYDLATMERQMGKAHPGGSAHD
jgi:limonene-1,2-epoxide hydrolase